jgi:hypothetical protein
MGSGMMALDAVVLRRTCGAQELLHPMPTFLKTDTCSALVLPLAYALQEEESRSVSGCPWDEYVIPVVGPYI